MPLCDEGSFATFKIFSTAYQICLIQKAVNLRPEEGKQGLEVIGTILAAGAGYKTQTTKKASLLT